MRHASHIVIAVVLVMLCSTTASGIFYSSGWWYSDNGNERYNPSTGAAQYMNNQTMEWVDDVHSETNSAKNDYLAGGYSSDSSRAQKQGYSQAIQNNGQRPGQMTTIRLTASWYEKYGQMAYGSPSSGSSYDDNNNHHASDLPEWDYDVFMSTGMTQYDFQSDSAGTKFESDVRTVRVGLNAVKDRLMLLNEVRYECAEGKRDFDGVDSRTTGVLLMPGYRVWDQDELPVNVDVFGVLDLAYQNYSSAGNQWRFSPGVCTSLSRLTGIGLFQTSYTFANSRNTDGDTEVTGKSYINIHNVAANYVMPLVAGLFLGTGLSYTKAEDVTGSLEDDFTEARVNLGSQGFKNLTFAAGYFQSIDNSDTRGFDVHVAYRW